MADIPVPKDMWKDNDVVWGAPKKSKKVTTKKSTKKPTKKSK